MAVVRAHRVHLLFVTFDAVRSADVVAEEPRLALFAREERVREAACKQRPSDESEEARRAGVALLGGDGGAERSLRR